MNERITESLVRKQLRAADYYDSKARVEEQKSEISQIQTLLRNASKTGKGGRGQPEFIITSPDSPDFVIIIECKPTTDKHESKNRNSPKDFAVDGVLHYAKFLSVDYNVISIAVSGQEKFHKTSVFLTTTGDSTPSALTNEHGEKIASILAIDELIRHASFKPEVREKRHKNLMSFSRELHEFMRDHAKLTENEKPLLVSGTLIALRNKPFSKSFGEYSPKELQKAWHQTIRDELNKADIPNSKFKDISQPYSSIAVHPELGKIKPKFKNGVLHELIKRLHEKVWPFIGYYQDFDVVGQFYGEFLKYSGGDKKSLGIVLTPHHITELTALLASVDKKSRVLDTCAGTGGFLISAMNQMLRGAKTKREEDIIKKSGLVGVEQQPSMFALAASNMMLRGDGKANLFQGDCFDPKTLKDIKAHKCTVGMINPPYSQKEASLKELEFVDNLLDCLKPGSIGIAIIPIPCAIKTSRLKEKLLSKHTLDSVMSLPDDLFYPVATVTCLMVFVAGKPHDKANKKTWFGYWKNDGFVKSKHRGRTDSAGKWSAIRDQWVSRYRNREVHAGESVMKMIGASDEWCAEAYMTTNYERLDSQNMERKIRQYLANKLLHDSLGKTITSAPVSKSKMKLSIKKWKEFNYDEVFQIINGYYNRKPVNTDNYSDIPFIGATENRNGVTSFASKLDILELRKDGESESTPTSLGKLFQPGCLTVSNNGSVGNAFYQTREFTCSHDVNVLRLLDVELNPYIAMFLTSIIELEKYRWNYGRKWRPMRMPKSKIRLPITGADAIDWQFMENYVKSLPYSKSL